MILHGDVASLPFDQEMGSVYEVEWGDGVQSKTVLYRPELRDEKESHAS